MQEQDKRSTFLGLMVLRQGRANLGAPAHPDSAELDSVLAMLAGGLTRG